jgi:hypothetical protein
MQGNDLIVLLVAALAWTAGGALLRGSLVATCIGFAIVPSTIATAASSMAARIATTADSTATPIAAGLHAEAAR